MITSLALLLVAALAAIVLTIRTCWWTYAIARYSITASWWVTATRQGAVVADEMSIAWPLSDVLWRLWSWDLRDFLVHQDLYDEAAAWIEGQLARTDLTAERFAAEFAAAMGTAKPDATTAAGPAPLDPSRN